MLKFPRAAGPVATFVTILALTGLSSPGKALGLDQLPETAAAITVPVRAINPPVPGSVPTPDMSSATTDSPDEVHVANATPPAAGISYASLAAAVADQQVAGEGDSELTCLAGAIYFESKGEPLTGQLAVANVIINRTTSGRFPHSICGVVRQPGQFSFVRGGRIPDVRSGAQYRTALAIAKVAIDKDWDNPAPQALFFHARRVSPGWGKARVASIGNHIFYR
jgi:spore germination cell wall hydrolase CwlJ-like protein